MARLDLIRLPAGYSPPMTESDRLVFQQSETIRIEGSSVVLRVESRAWSDHMLGLCVLDVYSARKDSDLIDEYDVVEHASYVGVVEHASYVAERPSNALVQREAIRLYDEARAALLASEAS